MTSITTTTTTTTPTTSATEPPPTLTTQAVPILPTEIELAYLAEGAANIIYRLSHPSPVAPFDSDVLSTHLVRLRKTLPSAQPNLTAYTYLSTTAFPLFPRHLLVETELIRVPRSVLVRENARLLEREARGDRPKKRAGMYLETSEEYAFMVADMSPHTPRQLLVEFKPKWVVQSPSAPKTARRCRTCALRLKKGAGKGFCPLDLASRDSERVRRAVRHVLPKTAPKGFVTAAHSWEEERERLQENVVRFLVQSELMPVLAGLQRRLDPEGPLGSMGEGFLDAMTVRDLTVFMRVDMDAQHDGVDCGIADLDMKSPAHGKEMYWRNTERELIDGGFYESFDGPACEFS